MFYDHSFHEVSSAADYQQGQQAMSIFTGAVIHGGQFNVSISSLKSITDLGHSRNWDKVHKEVQKTKSTRLDSE